MVLASTFALAQFTMMTTYGFGVGDVIKITLANGQKVNYDLTRLLTSAPSVYDLVTYYPSTTKQVVYVEQFNTDASGGGGPVRWSTTCTTSNGGTLIDPALTDGWDGTAADLAATYYGASGQGSAGNTGCWERSDIRGSSFSPEIFGVTSTVDMQLPMQLALDYAAASGSALDLGSKTYTIGPPATGRICLQPPSGTTIYADGATLILADSAGTGVGDFGLAMIMLYGVTDVSIDGVLYLDGNRENQAVEQLAVEKGAIGLHIESSSVTQTKNINLGKIIGYDWQKDAVWIGHNAETQPEPADITAILLSGDNCGRNGISITGAIGLAVDTIIGKNSNGTDPEMGLDIEPNNISNSAIGISIGKVLVHDNAQEGIGIIGKGVGQLSQIHIDSLISYNNFTGGLIQNLQNVDILRAAIYDNDTIGLQFGGDLRNIRMLFDAYDNGSQGFAWYKGAGDSDGIHLSGSSVYRNGQSATADGFLISASSGTLDDLQMYNFSAYDDAGTPTQRYGINLNSATVLSNFGGSGRRLDGNTSLSLLGFADKTFETLKLFGRIESPIIGAVAANATTDAVFALTGVQSGDIIVAQPELTLDANNAIQYVLTGGTDQINVHLTNPTDTSINVQQRFWRFVVTRYE